MLMGANLYSKNAEYALFTTESALIKRKKQNVKKKPVVSVISSYKPAFSLGFFYSHDFLFLKKPCICLWFRSQQSSDHRKQIAPNRRTRRGAAGDQSNCPNGPEHHHYNAEDERDR